VGAGGWGGGGGGGGVNNPLLDSLVVICASRVYVKAGCLLAARACCAGAHLSVAS